MNFFFEIFQTGKLGDMDHTIFAKGVKLERIIQLFVEGREQAISEGWKYEAPLKLMVYSEKPLSKEMADFLKTYLV